MADPEEYDVHTPASALRTGHTEVTSAPVNWGRRLARVQPAPGDTQVSAVAIKLPPFWPHDPRIWFAQAEAMFHTRGIRTERTMFDYVVSALAPEFVLEVRDLVLTPPPNTPYSVLKEQLIQRTELSEQDRLLKMLSDEELGDRKPSQFLRRLQQLLGNGTLDDSFLHARTVSATLAGSCPDGTCFSKCYDGSR